MFVCLVKEECVSEEEEEEEDTVAEEILQQGDTAIIYPEAPEDEQSPVETGGADENGNFCLLPSTRLWIVSQNSAAGVGKKLTFFADKVKLPRVWLSNNYVTC